MAYRASRVLRATILISTLVSLMAATAMAGHEPHQRNGFLAGLNLGAGRLNIPGGVPRGLNPTGNYQNPVREWGIAEGLRVGYAFRDRFALGLELSGWKETGSLDGYGLFAGTVTLYPASGGAYVRGGVGVGNGNLRANGTGRGILGAIGYEWRLGQRGALGPQIDFINLKIDQWAVSQWYFTFGYTIYR